MLVCLSELPKWSGRLWSMRLPTAQWYSPNTGWRRCWSASDFWWAFLIVSRTVVSLHLMSVQNTPGRIDEVCWIDGGHSGHWVTQSPAEEQQSPVCSCTWFIIDTCVQMSWVTLWKSWIPSFNQNDSCVGYPAADPGALYCRLAQELQKNPSISQRFTIANAETAALALEQWKAPWGKGVSWENIWWSELQISFMKPLEYSFLI